MSNQNDLFTTCLAKQHALKIEFSSCTTPDQKYQKIINLGNALSPLHPEFQIPQNRVEGCQSALYLHAELINGKVYFKASSDALISAGLAALLLQVYNGETPEVILKCPPLFLEELGIPASLSPNRSNGLASLFLRMKQESLKLYSNSLN